MTTNRQEQRTANSTYKKLAVQWLKEALCFVPSSVLADSFRLRNRQLLVAVNCQQQYKEPQKKSAYIQIVFLFTFLLFSNAGFGQSSEIRITFIDNCGLHLTDGSLNIYVDFPYKSGAFNYMEYSDNQLDSIKENSIFIFTHKHPDHYSIKQMRKTLRKKKGHKYGKWNLDGLQQFSDTTEDFSIQAIKTEHSLSFKHYSYLMTWHGKRIYFSGDIETASDALAMKDLDWAFVPYWIMQELHEMKGDIDAVMVGVYHFYPVSINTNSRPEKIKLLDKEGEVISVPFQN